MLQLIDDPKLDSVTVAVLILVKPHVEGFEVTVKF